MASSHNEQHMTRHPSFGQYVLIAVVLFVITIVEFLMIWERLGIDWESSQALGHSKVPLLVLLSALKFAIVIMFYMHLKFESRLFAGIFLSGLALAFAAGIAVLGIFAAIGGDARSYAQDNALPYEGHGEESAQALEHEAPHVDEPDPPAIAGPTSLQIGSIADRLEFDTSNLTAPAGSEVVLTFHNSSTVYQHNWVLVGSGDRESVVEDGLTAGEENGWVPPNDERVLAQIQLLGPGQTEEVRFSLEPGLYEFVCTFPAHNLTMFGDLEATGDE